MLARHTAAETLAQARRHTGAASPKYEDRVGAVLAQGFPGSRVDGLARPGSSQRHPGLGLSPALPRLPLARTLRAPPSARQALPEPPSKPTWPFAFQPSPDHCSILLPAQKPSWPLVNPTCFFSNHARFPSERRSLRLLPRPPRCSVRFGCSIRLAALSGSSGVLSRQGVVLFFFSTPISRGPVFWSPANNRGCPNIRRATSSSGPSVHQLGHHRPNSPALNRNFLGQIEWLLPVGGIVALWDSVRAASSSLVVPRPLQQQQFSSSS